MKTFYAINLQYAGTELRVRPVPWGCRQQVHPEWR